MRLSNAWRRFAGASLAPGALACILALGAPWSSWCRPTARASDFWDALRSGPSAQARKLERLRVEVRSGRAAEALPEIEAAANEASSSTAMQVLLARALDAVSKPREALARLEHALKSPSFGAQELDGEVLALIRLSVGLHRADLAARLLDHYDSATPHSSERAMWLVLRGHVLGQLDPSSLPAALSAYRAALRLAPDDAPALIGLALALHRQGDAAAALATARRVRDPLQIERAPSGVRLPNAEISARLAIWRESVGDLEGARAAWQAAAREGSPFKAHAEQARARLGSP